MEKALFGHGPDCDLGFCLGSRLGERRGPKGPFSAKLLRKNERLSLSRVKQKPFKQEGPWLNRAKRNTDAAPFV